MAAGVDQLRPRRLRHGTASPVAAGAGAALPHRLDTLLHDSWEGFKSLVDVRRSDQPPRLGLGDIYGLRQDLRLQLDAARFALLRRDRDLYRTSLDTAASWLKTFFDTTAPEVHLYQDDLARLRAADPAPPLPDLGPTLKALRGLLDAKPAGTAP
jgi:uncharacterized protein HemX